MLSEFASIKILDELTFGITNLNNHWSIAYATGKDGAKIRYGLFSEQSNLQEKNYLVFCNGRSEWLEKYNQLPIDLNLGKHTEFLTLDHRGQGETKEFPFHIDSYETYSHDLKNVIKQAFGANKTNIKYGIIAHSMGGLIALFATLQGYINPQFLILCSPLLELPSKPFGHHINRLLAQILTCIGLGKTRTGATKPIQFEDNHLTHSLSRFSEIVASPYPSKRPSFAWVDATYRALEIVHSPNHLARLNIPILVLGGTEEKLLNYSSFKKWTEKVKRYAKSKIEYKDIVNGRHELLFEREDIYQATLDEIKNFLAQNFQP